ncbi:hypothetical protein ACSSV1_006171 [Labrenzia sp. MBR-25]
MKHDRIAPAELPPFSTLEDLQDIGYSLSTYCITCNQYQLMDISNWIQKLGRAFPLCQIKTKLELFGINQCHPETRICCLTKSNEHI